MRKLSLSAALAAVVGLGFCAMRLAAQQETPKVELKRIGLTEPGTYKDSGCLYVMTKDVTAKGKGFRFEGKNYIVDLGGNTLTFNTDPYTEKDPKEHWLQQPVFGILLLGENAELRNGRIIQGPGQDKAGDHDPLAHVSCVFIRAKGCRVHDTVTLIRGGDIRSNFWAKWAGTDVELDHNYMVNLGAAESRWSAGVALSEAGENWDIHHNTIIGAHHGINVGGRREKENIHIHHNYISNQRIRGEKSPQAVAVGARGCEIDHNEIVTIDGRGLMSNGGGNNFLHDNVVDVRYSSKAAGGFYPENRCYGYWSRDAEGNRITDNLFVVNNENVGDEASNTIGISLCTSIGRKDPMRRATVTGNRVFVHHNDKARPAWGFELAHVGDEVVFKDNYVWADTAGALVDDLSKGAAVEGNTFVKCDDKWQLTAGAGAANCVLADNKVVPPPTDKTLPGAPRGLTVVRRFNGYELHWEPNPEADVLGYYVWRNGKRLDERMKCTRFCVDTSAEARAAYSYEISAVDMTGNEGPKCPPVPTALARDRMDIGRDEKPE